jgi:uncharacterized membrane protein AbrB (regulator of aidB expression)
MISTQMVLRLVMSWLLVRFFNYDLPTATLAPSPGAISAVISTADETRADTVVVTFIHLVRLNAVIIVVPVLVYAVLQLLGLTNYLQSAGFYTEGHWEPAPDLAV